ncbi:MAG: hypothetical protein VB063_14060 [Bacteroides graminisolvens]|nr:hypothetical protein [Bacteroides graminisolvens]
MKTRLIGAVVVALALFSPAPGLTDDNIKYSQCLNTFKEKDGIQTGTIVKMATGEVFETLGSAFSYDKDLNSPLCTIIKDRRHYYLLVSGVGRKILVRRMN